VTLFDNKPLTETEIRSRLVCICDHTYGAHRGGTNCTKCGCEEFEEASGGSDMPKQP